MSWSTNLSNAVWRSRGKCGRNSRHTTEVCVAIFDPYVSELVPRRGPPRSRNAYGPRRRSTASGPLAPAGIMRRPAGLIQIPKTPPVSDPCVRESPNGQLSTALSFRWCAKFETPTSRSFGHPIAASRLESWFRTDRLNGGYWLIRRISTPDLHTRARRREGRAPLRQTRRGSCDSTRCVLSRRRDEPVQDPPRIQRPAPRRDAYPNRPRPRSSSCGDGTAARARGRVTDAPRASRVRTELKMCAVGPGSSIARGFRECALVLPAARYAVARSAGR